MKYSNTIEYNISTKLDSSGLTELQSQIKQLENSMQQLANKEFLNSDKVQNARSQLEGLNTALTNSFNSSLGILDLSKFRAELDSSGVSAQELQSIFNMMGAEGQTTLNGLTSQIANFNGGMERTSSQIDKIFTTFSNTFRWGLVSSFFSQFMNAIHSSVDYVKELDDSLTQIMLVTDYNRDSMNEFARSANEAAKAVSMTTTGMTNASLIFAQQGYDLGQSQELATLSAKVANASQQDTATTSDQITAYMNAYGLENSIDELTQAMDNWALIANISAADVGELAQASQRAASMANAVGVSGEQLASQIATIESVTREAPEQIGNGLKTLYARFSDIASGKEDEDGFTLGKVTSELNKIGVQVLDEMGQIRDVGDIMEDLMVIWDDLDQTSKVAASQALAGKYQVNRFMALMDNSDMYEEYKGATGANAAGTLDIMSEEYANSIEGRSAKLQASLEGLFSTIFNTDDIYPWMDAAQGAVDLLQQFFDALGGGKTVLLGITTLLTQAFSQNIARSINDTIANRNLGKIRENNINSVGDTLDKVGIDKTQGIGAYIAATAQQSKLGALSDAQYDAYMNNVKNWADASTALAQSEEQLTDTINLTNAVFEKISPGTAAVTKGEFGALNTIEAKQVSLTDDAIKQNLHQVDFSEESENARQVALALRDVQIETNKTEVSQKDLGNAIDFVQDRLDDLGKTYNQDQSQELRNNLEKIKEDINQTGKISESAKKQIQQYITEMEHLSENLANLDETDAKRIIADRGNAAEKAFTTKQFNQTQVDRAEENALTGQQEIDKQLDIKDILDTLNAVQQLSFAWQAFQNLGSIWTNEDLSKGEKVLQTIMNLTTGISQVIVAIDNLKNVPKMLDQIQQGYQQWIQKIVDAKNAEIAQQNAEKQAAETEYYKAKGSLEAAQAKQQEAQQRVDNAKATNEEAKQEAELAESSLASAVANESVARSRLARAQAYRAEATAKRELLMLEAIENNDEAKLNTLEKQARIFDSINADKVAKAEAQLAKAEQEVADATARVNLANEKVNKSNKEVLEAQKQLTESKNQTVQAQQRLSQAYTVFSTLQSKQTQDFIDTISNTEKLTKVLDQMKEKLLGVGNSIKNVGSNIVQFFTSPLGLATAALAVVAGVAYGMFQDIERHKQEAIEGLEEAQSNLEKITNIQTSADKFKTDFNIYKESGEGGDKLIQQARDIADAMAEAGDAEQANIINLAALSAEANETSENFTNLAEVIENSYSDHLKNSYLDVISSSEEVLQTQGESLQYLLKEENKLKDLRQQLSDLRPSDPGYSEQKKDLEDLIKEQEKLLELNQEGLKAAHAHMEAEGNLAGLTVSENQGLNFYAGGQQGKRMNPDSAIWFENADLDYNSINRIYSNMVEGFSNLSNLEQAQFILETIGDEAGEAAAQVELLMLSFNNLDTNQIDHLQNEMAQSGFTHNQQQLLSASLDPDTTAAEFSQTIQNIAKNMSDNGTSFEVALKAEIGNPEEFQEAIRQQVESYQPLDAEIKQEDYNAMTEHFYENKDRMGEEGSGFENYSEDLFDNAEALSEVIEDTLRYSNAIEEISDNFNNWIDILNKGEKTSKEYVDAVDGLKDTFSDFLGIPEELSEEFVTTEKNLNDLQLAAEGDVDAFDRLQTAAAIDLAEQLGVDSDTAIAAVSEIQNALDSLGYNQIDIGETITFSDEALTQINNALDMLGLDAEQAAQFIESAFGFKVAPGQFEYVEDDLEKIPEEADAAGEAAAEGITVTPQVTTESIEQSASDEKNYTDVTATVTPEPWEATLPVTGGGLGSITTASLPAPISIRGSVPNVTYTARPKKQTEKKTETALATGVKGEHGGSGKPEHSHVNLKPGAQGIRTGGQAPSSSAPRPSSSGGGGGGKSCFIAGTLISTSFGYKPIELIKSNDFVLSYNESLHQNEYSKVVQTMIHDTIEPIYTLYIKNEQLRVTGIHRFLVSKDIGFESQWIAAQDLQIGDWVLLADNTWHLIWKIEVNLEHQIVYNFEVAGNHNYYVGYNQILAHNKGGSGKKGGGGSGNKAKTAKKKEAEKAEKKYYEEVDKQLEQTEETLKSLEKVTDKLTGTQARAKQNEQLKLLQKEKDLQEKKLKILQEQEKVDVSSAIKKADKDFEDLLKKQGVNFNLLDFTFDEDGFINNLDPVRESIANGINKLNDQYNAIIGDDGEVNDEEQERLKALDEEIQKLEKLGKEVDKNGTRYNEIVIEEQKIQNEMQEIQDQMQDIAIDAYKASQEAIDNLKDLRKEWAKFSAGLYDSSKGESFLSLDNPIRQLKEIENEISSIYAVSGTEARKYYDDIIAQQQKYLENAKTADEQQAYKDAIEYYEKLRDSIDDGTVLNNGLMQVALNDLTRLQEIWNNWNDEGGNGFFGDDKAALEKALEDAQKRVMEFAQDFEELIEDLKDASLDVVDHTMEQWDRQLDKYDRVIDQLDRYSDTYSLIYGDASYDMQEAVLSQQAQTLKSELDAAQEAYLTANTYYLEAYEKFVDKSTGLAKEGYEDYMYELEEAMNDAEDKVRDIAADAAEKFSEAFEAAVMASTQYILRNTIGENDFEHSDRNWEWDKEYIDKYKDGVEKAYEMDKLRNRYIDMLNNAQGASLQTQNKIRAQMQEQLDLLDGQKTVSEYDVKLANAKLEILQKQIALEDAQRNKNKMQLRRDTQGNYRYVYTADKDNVDQAQQELLDSEYDAYEMSKQQQMNNYDDMINAYKRYLSQREEILTNNNLSEAQKMEQIKELWDRFQKYVNAAQEDFGDATAGTVDILQWLVVNGTDYTATAATDMLNQLLDAEGNVAEQSGVIWMDLANNMANEVIPSIADAVTTADNVIEQKLVQTGIALVGEDGTGGVFGEVSNGANDFGDQCEMAANQTAILSEQSNKLKEALLGDSGAFKQAQEELANYQKQLEDVTNASAITAQTLRATQQALDQAKAENLNYRTQIDRLLSGQDIIVNHKIVDAEEYRRQQEEEKRKQQQRNNGGGGGRNALADARAIWYHGAWGNGGDWYTPYSRQFGTAAANKVLWYFNHGYGYNFDFDTGGYTGEWNQGEGVSSHKNGKLAFLHQKELILNAQDTENILSAVSMVRSLANSAQASMNNINTAASGNINSIYNPVTEQRVDIQASFPNATDAEDIRQALIGLSDRAYQYAHRVI